MESPLYRLLAHPSISALHVLSMLETPDIVRLDTAFLVHYCRSDLLDSYCTVPPVKLPDVESTTETRVRLMWFLSRGFSLDRPYFSIEHLQSKELQRHVVENLHAMKGGIKVSRIITLDTFADPNFLHPALVSQVDDVSIWSMRKPLPASVKAASLRLPFTNLTSLTWTAGLSNLRCLVSALKDNPRLEVFRMHHHESLPKEFYRALSHCGATLTTLQINASNFRDKDLREISQHCKCLRDVDLSRDLWAETNVRVTDVGVMALAEGCTHLEQVNLVGIPLTGAALTALFTHCVRLTHVTCPSAVISTAAVLALSDPARMACIEELSCSWGVKGPLNANCYALAFSEVMHLYINGVAVNSISTLCAALRVMSQLQSVAIVAPRDHPVRVPVCILEAIAASCTELLSLAVTRVVGDAECSLVTIAQHNPGLNHVQLKDVPVGITDAVLHALAEHCACLTEVDLSCANLVTDASVIALARACSCLHTLALQCCTRLTDGTIHALVDHCRELRSLDVRDSTLIRAPALELLLRMCTRLYHLEISSASITEAAVQRFQSSGNLSRLVWVSRKPVPFRTWVAAKAASVMSVLSRSRNVVFIAPAEGLLDNVCV